MLVELQNEETEIEVGGTVQQKISSCLEVMDLFMKQNEAVVSSIAIAEKTNANGSGDNVVDCIANIIGK